MQRIPIVRPMLRFLLPLVLPAVATAQIGWQWPPPSAMPPRPQQTRLPDYAADPCEAPTRDELLAIDLGSGVTARLVDVSLDTMIAVGTSTERDASLADLQGGGHDPRARGFTLQNVELAIRGAVDPYFDAAAYMIYSIDPYTGESAFELEEAFLTTHRLAGFELEVGQMFTEYGRHNPLHPHEWTFLDQPIINTRLFGGDGIRAPGARVGWRVPVCWFAQIHAGVQNARGETMASFFANDEFAEERAIGGRPFVEGEVRSLADLVYVVRLENRFSLGEAVDFTIGASGLTGPNATGSDGRTWIYGADVMFAWRPQGEHRAGPSVVFEAEVSARDYRADAYDDGTIAIARDTLHDWGGFAQVHVGIDEHWSAGLRAETVTARGASVDPMTGAPVSIDDDPYRDDRFRISPLVAWQPSHFSRVRLQYNYDRAKHLRDGDAHSIWLGFDVLIGRHRSHGDEHAHEHPHDHEHDH